MISDDGITKSPTVDELRMKHLNWQGGAVARGALRNRSEASHEIDLSFSSGQRWFWDYSRGFNWLLRRAPVPRDFHLSPLPRHPHLPGARKKRCGFHH